ncbi:serine O-acetyltransferase [Rubritalea squalenifaciens DSM 18772]|uniref:Serine acetyltransferase n=2 Tax=Rubritalea TaxID=361050 RepID=A0A1M6MFJ3_9BACT|nr:serine O-acetyltransferase [Rubritalea squalenifaciens]SHJ82262.1 serine O-acetyltransferase [Rubritalea squalenifaciens DSM 18772]
MTINSSPNAVTLCQSHSITVDEVWQAVRNKAESLAKNEPQLQSLLSDVILDRPCLGTALAARLSRKLGREDMSRGELMPLLKDVFVNNPMVTRSAAADMMAIYERDPACKSPMEPMLFFKGFMAMATYRVSHFLWKMDRTSLALYFQSICSEVFGVDIHPAARIGCGILLDHATSVVIGETAIVEDNVSILHEVTLGGTGKVEGDRHPIVRSGVLIGAGSKILGRVEIGRCAKIGAGSVVLNDVPAHATVAGVPAVIVGQASEDSPALEMNQSIECGQI